MVGNPSGKRSASKWKAECIQSGSNTSISRKEIVFYFYSDEKYEHIHMSQTKIPEHLYSYFEKAGHLRTYQSEETIYFQGEDAQSLYFIKSGRVRAYYITSSGKELTFEIIEKGRVFGESSFLAQSICPVSVCAVNDVEVLICDLDHLLTYMEESKELMRIMLQLLSNTCNHLGEQLRRITLYDRYQKIASFLLYETQHPDIDRGVTTKSIPYTQEDLALTLGMHRVSVNKVLNEWKKQNIIATAYGRITILDRAYLHNLLYTTRQSL